MKISPVGRLLVSAARLDRTQSDPVVSARNALGIALPLVIGAGLGDAAYGLPSTIGAIQVAFADRPGPYRLRMLRMLGTAAAAAATSAVAVVCSGSTSASIALLLVLGFIAGLLVSGGPSAAQVGIAGTVAALILGHTPNPLSAAGHVAWLVLVGGVGQSVLAVAAWPVGRHRPERRVLARAYHELAILARRPPGTDVGPPAGDVLRDVRTTLYGLGHDHGPSVEAYRVLLDEAERIRRELIVLSEQAQRLWDAGEKRLTGAIRSVLSCSAPVLDEVSAALADGRPVNTSVLDPVRRCVDEQFALLTDSGASGGVPELTTKAAATGVRSLAGQLRAAVETARTGATEGRGGDEPEVYGFQRLRDPVALLRANLTPSSAIARHAARIAVLLAGSDLVVRLAGFERGYWVPLTVLVVLGPDFATTLQRATMRVLGTLVGLVLATALVHWIPAGQWYAVVLVALLAFGMRLAGPGNVGLSALCLAGLVVILLELYGIAAHTSVELRAVDTVVGGGLALLAMLAFPLWERQLLPDQLGALLGAYRNYLAAITDPAVSAEARERARTAARLARANAQVSVGRVRSEPVRVGARAELGETVLVHTHRIVRALMTIDAVHARAGRPIQLPEFKAFTAAVARTLTACEQAVRTGREPQETPRLRPLAHAVTDEPAVIEALDRITNSVDTLLAELHRQLGA